VCERSRSGVAVIDAGRAGSERSFLRQRIPRRTPEGGGGDRCIASATPDGWEIADKLGCSLDRVPILTRIGLGKLSRLEPAEAANRYEKQRPGELVHVDVKKLGKIARPGHRVTGRVSAGGHHRRAYDLGWEYVHVCVDDATRLAYVEVLADETAVTAAGFLRRASPTSTTTGSGSSK
jgi:hypothetical protein